MAIAIRLLCARGAPERSDFDRIARFSGLPLGKPAVVSVQGWPFTTAAASAPRGRNDRFRYAHVANRP
jgi:hypothetical protein